MPIDSKVGPVALFKSLMMSDEKMNMLKIGCHLSVSKGYAAMVEDAISIGANTFAFFLRNPRGGSAKALDPKDMAKCRELLKTHAFGPLVAHAPYTLNPCAAKPDLREFAVTTMLDDLKRLDELPGNYYNFHPGSHVSQGAERGIELTGDFLKRILETPFQSRVLIETMAGKGSEIGRNFGEVAAIMSRVGDTNRLGVCLDTCHIWDGGYNIVEDLDGVLDKFDAEIGLNHLYAIHLNDSMNPFEAHKDRHAKINEGHIGFDALLKVVTHPKLKHLPFILETPNELPGYAQEIAMFRNAVEHC